MTLTTVPFLFLLLLLQHSAGESASPAPSPGPPARTDIFKILIKPGQYTLLIRLMKTTKVGDQINNELISSDAELTLFAPTDNAFSALETGTLNQLTDQQKVQLLQYHIVPSFISISNFQTLTNPVQTQASDTYQYPLNVTTKGNQVNITTGIVNATVSNTVYSDDQLAVYQVDQVLRPLGIFAPRPPPPTPAPAVSVARAHPDDSASVDVSGGGIVTMSSSFMILLASFELSWLFLVTYVTDF